MHLEKPKWNRKIQKTAAQSLKKFNLNARSLVGRIKPKNRKTEVDCTITVSLK
jgi:hypothetical protein